MTRRLAVLALALLAACGGKDPVATAGEADAALLKGDSATAQKLAEEGLAVPGVASDNGTSWRLERVRIQAIANQGDAATVLEEVERLGKTYTAPNQVNADFYARVSRGLVDAGKLTESLDLIEGGKAKFPKDASKFDGLIEELVARAESGGDGALTDKLAQLGYVSDVKKKKPAADKPAAADKPGADAAKPAAEPAKDMCSHCAGSQAITAAGACEACGMTVDCCAHCAGDQKLSATGTCPGCNAKVPVKT
jgi:hypothetical protein